MAVLHGNGADGKTSIGAHFEHAHFVLQQVGPAVGGAFGKDDDGQVVLYALAHLHAGGFSAFGTGSLDPNGADGVAAPSDDGPALDFCLGHENKGVGRGDHDRIDVGPVVGHQYARMVRQLAFHGDSNPGEPMDVAAIPRVRSVQAGVVGPCELSGQCTDGGSQR